MALVPAALAILLAVLFILKFGYVLATAAALPATRGAMFTSTHPLRVEAALEALRLSPGELLYDLGCGDGRFLAAACRRGARAVGFELNGWAYLLARLRTFRLPQARVRLASFWEEDLSGADCVVCYLFPDVMAKLAAKLEAELRPGARVASCNFPLPGWRPERVIRLHHPTERDPIYLYGWGGAAPAGDAPRRAFLVVEPQAWRRQASQRPANGH